MTVYLQKYTLHLTKAHKFRLVDLDIHLHVCTGQCQCLCDLIFLQGFLRNERENAILAAIEEARKNVS